MTLLRALFLSLSVVVLASCGGSGSEAEIASTTVTTGDEDTQLDTSGDGETAAADSVGLVPVSGCFVQASELDLTPVWKGQAAGLAAIVSRDGEELYTTAPAEADATGSGAFSDVDVELGTSYTYAIQTVDAGGETSELVPCGSGQLLAQSSEVACGLRVSDAGLPELSWEGVLLVQEVAVLRDGAEVGADVDAPFIDDRAPLDTASSYSIVVSDATGQGRESQTIDCGTATPNVADAPALDLAAATDNARNFLSPYQFVVLEPICPDCSGTVDLYLTPGDPDHIVDQAWVNGSSSTVTDDPWMVDPLVVPPLLVAAEANGSTVTFDLDRDTGLVREWTIDGVGARYECVEVDTRPLDMRTRECTANIFND